MIRLATIDDVESITSMWSLLDDHVVNLSRYLEKDEEYDKVIKKFITELVDSKIARIFLAEKDQKIIGFSSGHIENMPWFKGNIGLLGSCWVVKIIEDKVLVQL